MRVWFSSCVLVFFVFFVCGCSEGGSGEAEPTRLLTDSQDAPSTASGEDTQRERSSAGESESEDVEDDEVREGALSEALFTNDTGGIGAEVPDGWDSRLTDEVWVLGGRPLGPGFTVSTDVQAWETGSAPGAFVAASASLGGEMSADRILDSEELDLSTGCTAEEREDFEDHGYEGRIQGWSNCAAGGKSVYTVVASENGGECVMMVQVGYVSDEERRLAEDVLASFDSDCEKVREFEAGLEDFVVEEEAPPAIPEEAEIPTLSCSGFGSQYDAQQFYDYTADEGERAILDPDANGFACDLELLGYPLEYIEPEVQEPAFEEPTFEIFPPDERDGICEGPGETDPDCADAMEESLRTTNPEMFD